MGGAVVVFDLRLRRVKWQQHLDLSTDSTPYRAYIYSAPVLVDLDRDGKLEVVVGTSAVRNPVSALQWHHRGRFALLRHKESDLCHA